MAENNGRFKKGEHRSPSTEFKKGQHWRDKKPYWEKDYLVTEYELKQRSSGDIALEWGIKDVSIIYWLKKHGIQRRGISDVRRVKKWGSSGESNGMYGRTGSNNPRWKGGCTPERQAFYSSSEWSKSCAFVWRRDGAVCQRCGCEKTQCIDFHIHHIVSFSVKELRADVTNLILLCKPCHLWVHSKKNKNKDFIKEVGHDG